MKMVNNYKKNSVFAGLMFLLAIAVSLTGDMLIQGNIDESDFIQGIIKRETSSHHRHVAETCKRIRGYVKYVCDGNCVESSSCALYYRQ